ncbi:leucine-rich repeat-containing G-protein coupled receptor 5-like [Lutzomyia longipalpis]|uniref:leucine-rich repeat-containing G-protein coupled receptor 5-like n=1 Tax=Lutzomyia longipalpis TaxID=7200 RepID=UPI002483F1DF|nr:leucine-rich repeat-containing G-protein coupled receptor 5-like [Lutzomyia longipalpis]
MIFLGAILLQLLFITGSSNGTPLEKKILQCDDSKYMGSWIENWQDIDAKWCVLKYREFTDDVDYSFKLEGREKIVYLQILDSSMINLPRSLLSHLGFVREFTVSNSSLKHVDRLNFKFESLYFVNFSNNAIESINDHAFANFEDLKIISLSNNRLTHLKGFPFPFSEKNLDYDFSHNKIESIAESVFGGKDIIRLILTNNSLESVEGIFKKVVRLGELNLSYNKLKKFQPTVSLRTSAFDLSSNFLESVDFTKIDASTINTLKVNDNLLTKISLGSSITSLTLLQLEKNKFGDNLQDICKCSKVMDLSLKDNLIRDIGSCFSEMKTLNSLNLAKNQIETIKPESFHKDNAIETLDLAFNRIESFNKDTMSVFGHLKVLNLTGNRLQDFYDYPKTIMYNLKVLGLSHNNFKCSRFTALQDKFSLLLNFFIDRSVPVNGKDITKEGCYDDKEKVLTARYLDDAILAIQNSVRDELKRIYEKFESQIKKVENSCSNPKRIVP